MMKKAIAALAAALSLAGAAVAEDGVTDIAVSPRFWGLGAGASYKAALAGRGGPDTELRLEAGGAWEALAYFRDAAGRWYPTPAPAEIALAAYDDWDFDWALGVEQGFFLSPLTGRNGLEAFLYYRGRSDLREDAGTGQYLFASGLPDAPSCVYHYFQLGLGLSERTRSAASGVLAGPEAELSLEWGPAALSSSAREYGRLNGSASWFLPLYESLEGRANRWSAYAGAFLDVDYSWGAPPLFVKQTFGGREPRFGLGDAVRGVDLGRYDASFKAVANVELRLDGPSFIDPTIYPIAVAFLDLGYCATPGEPYAFQQAFLASAGLTFMLNVFDLMQVGAGIVYCFDDTLGGSRLNLILALGHKF